MNLNVIKGLGIGELAGTARGDTGQRVKIPSQSTLPAYAQDGIIMPRIFKGSTDATFLESFIQVGHLREIYMLAYHVTRV